MNALRLAVITGGSRGIGAAVAARLHAEGARVVLLGRTERTLEQRCEELPGAEYRVADVTDEEAVRDAFLSLEATPDCLINNAGAATTSPFERMTSAAWRNALDLNLGGVFFCCRAVVPGMKERGSGRIVNIASTAALKGYRYVSSYCAAKHAVLGLTRALALELAGDGITVNAVCPGFTETEMLQESIETIMKSTGRTQDEARRALLLSNPQGRFIDPSEVADTVSWLCSDSARSITGQAIALCGGETA